jgi:hypothetical protein
MKKIVKWSHPGPFWRVVAALSTSGPKKKIGLLEKICKLGDGGCMISDGYRRARHSINPKEFMKLDHESGSDNVKGFDNNPQRLSHFMPT